MEEENRRDNQPASEEGSGAKAAKGPLVNRRFEAATGGSKKGERRRPSGKPPEEEGAICLLLV